MSSQRSWDTRSRTRCASMRASVCPSRWPRNSAWVWPARCWGWGASGNRSPERSLMSLSRYRTRARRRPRPIALASSSLPAPGMTRMQRSVSGRKCSRLEAAADRSSCPLILHPRTGWPIPAGRRCCRRPSGCRMGGVSRREQTHQSGSSGRFYVVRSESSTDAGDGSPRCPKDHPETSDSRPRQCIPLGGKGLTPDASTRASLR